MGYLPKVFISLLMVVGLLSGCTQMSLAYRNLDVIIPWSLSDYLKVKGEQKSWLDERLKQHLQWHCSTELPGYLTWLDGLEQMVRDDQVTAAGLQARTREAEQAIARIARQVTPSAVELLGRLDDRQVQEMQEAFERDQRKRQKEYLDQPLNEQIAERAERMQKRLSPWLGSLSAAQKARVQQWSASLGEQNQAWLANRANWQSRFLDAVRHRDQPDFAPRISALLQDRQTFWTADYREAYARTEQAAISLFVDIYAMSTPAQRQRLLKRIADMRSDFADLNCLKTAAN
ncbi:DUF6279 family lipoprotein [uncultured Pseudomonas sp.]|uniref:DUF6279 family lipoprotein n=1 Tax=uncultured Pseudomonas sp. TaxID=114707 RepID=UPI0025F3B7C4|nr:DUF6279 family lipoprotein [uncultured Pseudomonas sp.]